MNREPSGIPTGGQFATGARDEADVSLVPTSSFDPKTAVKGDPVAIEPNSLGEGLGGTWLYDGPTRHPYKSVIRNVETNTTVHRENTALAQRPVTLGDLAFSNPDLTTRVRENSPLGTFDIETGDCTYIAEGDPYDRGARIMARYDWATREAHASDQMHGGLLVSQGDTLESALHRAYQEKAIMELAETDVDLSETVARVSASRAAAAKVLGDDVKDDPDAINELGPIEQVRFLVQAEGLRQARDIIERAS